MKTTVKGICLNLNESEYYFKYKGLIFYFSSEFYKKKFADEISSFIETDKELKELMKVCLDKQTYNVLKDLF